MKLLKKFPKLKKIIYFILPRFSRTRIFWKFETLKFLFTNKLLTPRIDIELEVANNFRRYWENLGDEGRIQTREKLIRGLDTKSIEVVDTIIKRQLYIASHNILEQGKLFTKEELREQKECSLTVHEFSKIFWKYKLSVLSSECFYGLSGLKWLPRKITQQLKNNVVIDAGACEGDTALVFNLMFNPSSVYAFEPEKNNFKTLQYNSKLEKKGLLIPINKGLSAESGKAFITNSEVSSRITNNQHEQEVDLVSIDDFAQKNPEIAPKIKLIKMDIEGAEPEALKGALKTIQTYRPILAISIYHNASDFFEIKPWLENICPTYKFIIRKASPFSLTGETMLIAYTG